MKTKAQIAHAAKQLRAIIDDPSEDKIAQRIAYEVEQAIRWATEKTVGWPSPAQSAQDAADLVRSELK